MKKKNIKELKCLTLETSYVRRILKKKLPILKLLLVVLKEKNTIEIQFNRWHRRLVKSLHTSFRKIRVKESKENKISYIDNLLNKKKAILKKKTQSKKDNEELESLDNEISDECADKEYEKLSNILGDLETSAGSTNITNIWKQMKKSYPKNTRPLPTGVKNIEGKVITNPVEKKNVILDHFSHRMRKRPVKVKLRFLQK